MRIEKSNLDDTADFDQMIRALSSESCRLTVLNLGNCFNNSSSNIAAKLFNRLFPTNGEHATAYEHTAAAAAAATTTFTTTTKCDAAALSKTLVELNVAGNGLGVEGAKGLSNALHKCEKLVKLTCGGNQFGVDGLKMIADGLRMRHVQSFYLGEEAVVSTAAGRAALKAVLAALSPDACEHLELWNCRLGEEGLEELAPELKQLQKLEVLNLGMNCITGVAACTSMGDIVLGLPRLKRLAFSDNVIGPDGAAAFHETVLAGQGSKLLQLTYLRANMMELGPDDSAHRLLSTLQPGAITDLNLDANNLGDAVVSNHLTAFLSEATSLSKLSLSKNGIGPAGARALASSCKPLTTLTSFSIQQNCLNLDGLEALQPFLRQQKWLEVLWVRQTVDIAAQVKAASQSVKETVTQMHKDQESEHARVLQQQEREGRQNLEQMPLVDMDLLHDELCNLLNTAAAASPSVAASPK